jgi:ATP-dependent RNA helicase DeaD
MEEEPINEEQAELAQNDFEQFDLDPLVLESLKSIGYSKPTPIQCETIPLIQEGQDIIGLAQTGSGKTAACAIPMCDHVDVKNNNIQALIIVPTRELAVQYAMETQRIGKKKKVKAYAMYGGEDYSLQRSKLANGVHILISTPGRLIDFIYQREIDLSYVKTLVLDEADEMLSMGFVGDLEFIMGCLNHDHQTLLFSATMPKAIGSLAKSYMKTPIEVTLTSKDKKTPLSIEHYFLYCRHDQRDDALIEQMQKMDPTQAIIFCHSRIQVEKVTRALKSKLDKVDYLHAGLNQDLRSSITQKFRSGRVRFLVATDVASRGLDFSGVTHVFIYELSDDPDVFVHRSGRTGRQDRKGEVITLVTKRELGILQRILQRIGQEPKWIGEPPSERESTSSSRPPAKRRGPPRGRPPKRSSS